MDVTPVREDAGADAGDEDPEAGSSCPGTCKSVETPMWSDPLLLWIGPVGDPSAVCPAQAPVSTPAGYRDILATNICSPCECDTPTCVLPSGVVASDAPLWPMCPSNPPPGATLTPFDAPSGWDGSCVAAPLTIPSNLLASISVSAPTVSACVPHTAPVSKAGGGSIAWQTMGLACKGDVGGSCDDPGKTCVPSAPAGSGFRHCLWRVDDDVSASCPEAYPTKELFFSGWVDNRDCTPCECGSPDGSNCVALVSVYQNAVCGSLPLNETTVILGVSVCGGIAPNMVLSSMSAQWLTNEPGSCTPSGGEPIGTVEPAGPTVFCCEPAQ